MPIDVKNDNIQKKIGKIYAKENGVQKKIKYGYVKVDGKQKLFYKSLRNLKLYTFTGTYDGSSDRDIIEKTFKHEWDNGIKVTNETTANLVLSSEIYDNSSLALVGLHLNVGDVLEITATHINAINLFYENLITYANTDEDNLTNSGIVDFMGYYLTDSNIFDLSEERGNLEENESGQSVLNCIYTLKVLKEVYDIGLQGHGCLGFNAGTDTGTYITTINSIKINGIELDLKELYDNSTNIDLDTTNDFEFEQ